MTSAARTTNFVRRGWHPRQPVSSEGNSLSMVRSLPLRHGFAVPPPLKEVGFCGAVLHPTYLHGGAYKNYRSAQQNRPCREGERSERCRWQIKRGERVAVVKIGSEGRATADFGYHNRTTSSISCGPLLRYPASALLRSHPADRCHSFLLPSSATGGGRKRPPCVFFSPFFCDKTKEGAVEDITRYRLHP